MKSCGNFREIFEDPARSYIGPIIGPEGGAECCLGGIFEKNENEIPEKVASEHGDLLPNKNAERELSDVISKIRDLEKRLIA